MSNDKMNDTEDSIQIEKDQNPMKRPLVNDSTHVIKRTRSAGPGKRYRLLLACVVCSDDAHGK